MALPAEKTPEPNEAQVPVPPRVDVHALMQQIRERVKAEVARNGQVRPNVNPAEIDFAASGTRKAGELLHSEELRFLNTHYGFSAQLRTDTVETHRKGIIGKLIVAAKKKLLRILWDSILRDYLQAERDFNANVVRFLNDVSKYVDARDASNFWEIIRKIDVDVTKAGERIERIADEQSGTLRTTERAILDELNRSLREVNQQITELQGSSTRHEANLRTLDSVARGLEGIVARLKASGHHAPEAENGLPPASDTPDFSYLLLENRFRGSEGEIAARLGIYPEVFAGVALPILEIGAGRGELQQLFKAAGLQSYGVDLDAGMASVAREQGLDVRVEDGLTHLAGLSDRSLGGLIAVQVVEHLNQAQLHRLFSLATQKVAAGGLVVFETINPQSITALSSNYFRDPTHVWPLHPDTLAFALTLSGLDVREVRKLSPIPKEAQLKLIPVQEFMTPRWEETVRLFNHNLRQLNELLYGSQDYCVIAQVR